MLLVLLLAAVTGLLASPASAGSRLGLKLTMKVSQCTMVTYTVTKHNSRPMPSQMYLYVHANTRADGVMLPVKWSPSNVKRRLASHKNGYYVYLPRQMRRGQKFTFSVTYKKSRPSATSFSALFYEKDNYDNYNHDC